MQLRRQAGRRGQFALPLKRKQVVVPKGDLNRFGPEAVLPHSGCHAFCQDIKYDVDVLLTGQIPRRRGGIANAFDDCFLAHGRNGGCVVPIGKHVQDIAHFAEPAVQLLWIRPGQVPDGANITAFQLSFRGPSDIEQILHRQRPKLLPIILFPKDGHSVRFFIVRPQFGKNLIGTRRWTR